MNDIKVKGYPNLYRRDGITIVNKDDYYDAAIIRLQKQEVDKSIEMRLAKLETALKQILSILNGEKTEDEQTRP